MAQNWIAPSFLAQSALATIASFLVAGGMVRMALWQMRHGEVKPGLLLVPGKTGITLVIMALMATAANAGLMFTMLSLLASPGMLVVILAIHIFGTILFILAIPFAVARGANALQAPAESVTTIFPHYFSALGTMLLVWLVFIAIGCVVLLPFGFIFGMADAHPAGQFSGFAVQAQFAGTLMPFYYLTVTGLYSEFVDGRIKPKHAPLEDSLPEIRLR